MLEYVQKKNPDVVCAVPCTVCHETPRGGIGTLHETGFIENLRGVARLRALEPASIAPALAALEANTDCPTAMGAPCDSDADGMTDIQELYMSRDPDGDRNFDDCVKYGCGATVAPQRSQQTDLAPLWLVAALGAAAVIRRARS
jgi:MYXO-CTERM domain-containing protein